MGRTVGIAIPATEPEVGRLRRTIAFTVGNGEPVEGSTSAEQG